MDIFISNVVLFSHDDDRTGSVFDLPISQALGRLQCAPELNRRKSGKA